MRELVIERLAGEIIKAGWRMPEHGETACMGELYRTHRAAVIGCVDAWIRPDGESVDLSIAGVTSDDLEDEDLYEIGLLALDLQGEPDWRTDA